jgi:hypothetical protein
MLSELDELGKMICRRCIDAKQLVLFRGAIYIPPNIKPCDNDVIRNLWIQSAHQ